MKNVKKCAFQGDVMIRRVSSIPAEFKESPRSGPIVVSHSETGHHHSIFDDGVRVFESQVDPLVCYLLMDDSHFDLQHLRPYDTHETLRLEGEPGAVWEVRRQREYTPEGWRRVQD